MERQRLKVLLGCYACSPYFGSEPGTGWNFVRTIAQYHDVHAIVEKDEFEEDLARYSAEHPDDVKNITFHFVKRHHHNILRKIWPPSYYWFYRAWQKRAYKLAVKLHQKEKFDIVHQVSLIGYREPGYLWKLDLPYIWGPLGGLNQTAWCLLRGMSFHTKLYFLMRNILNWYQKNFSSLVRSAAARAHTIFVSDPQGIQDVRTLWRKEPRIMREVGTNRTDTSITLSSHAPGTPLKICWVGELIPLKALDILLEAITYCKHSMQVEVLGRGPELDSWKKKCVDLGLEHCVTFHGFVPHDTVSGILCSSHVLCVTSIKEGGTSTVVLEALQCGLPIITLNHCGHASVVHEQCGFKVDIHSRLQIVRDIAAHLDELANNEELRSSFAQFALQHSLNYTWEKNGELLDAVYQDAVRESRSG